MAGRSAYSQNAAVICKRIISIPSIAGGELCDKVAVQVSPKLISTSPIMICHYRCRSQILTSITCRKNSDNGPGNHPSEATSSCPEVPERNAHPRLRLPFSFASSTSSPSLYCLFSISIAVAMSARAPPKPSPPGNTTTQDDTMVERIVEGEQVSHRFYDSSGS